MKRTVLSTILLLISSSVALADFDLAKAKNASVRIITEKEHKYRCGSRCQQEHTMTMRGGGSGTIVASLKENDYYVNYVISANHVVAKDETITIEVFENDQSLGGYKGELLLEGSASDQALIRFYSYPKLPFIPIASSDHKPEIGENLISVGCPGANPPPRLVEGEVKILYFATHSEEEVIICEGKRELGRSGGGLMNKQMMLVGVLSYTYEDKYNANSSWKEIIKMLKDTEYEFLVK